MDNLTNNNDNNQTTQNQKVEIKNKNTQNNTIAQTYSSMLNNLQYLNAVGLSRLYSPNKQQPKKQEQPQIDEAFYDKMYKYVTERMERDGLVANEESKQQNEEEYYDDYNSYENQDEQYPTVNFELMRDNMLSALKKKEYARQNERKHLLNKDGRKRISANNASIDEIQKQRQAKESERRIKADSCINRLSDNDFNLTSYLPPVKQIEETQDYLEEPQQSYYEDSQIDENELAKNQENYQSEYEEVQEDNIQETSENENTKNDDKEIINSTIPNQLSLNDYKNQEQFTDTKNEELDNIVNTTSEEELNKNTETFDSIQHKDEETKEEEPQQDNFVIDEAYTYDKQQEINNDVFNEDTHFNELHNLPVQPKEIIIEDNINENDNQSSQTSNNITENFQPEVPSDIIPDMATEIIPETASNIIPATPSQTETEIASDIATSPNFSNNINSEITQELQENDTKNTLDTEQMANGVDENEEISKKKKKKKFLWF